MVQERRCGDVRQGGFWPAVTRFFSHTTIKVIIGGIVVAIITTLAAALWNMPAIYAQKNALDKLSDQHRQDIQLLDNKKLDKDEYEKRHQEIINNLNDTKQMTREIYSHALGKEYKAKRGR